MWDAYVDGRLARAGRGVPGAHAERCRQFRRAFPELGDGVDTAFEGFWSGARRTHAEMVAFASGPRAPRCQLCRLPSRSMDRARLPARALAVIAEDFPTWDPGAPICERCAEVYTMVPLERDVKPCLSGASSIGVGAVSAPSAEARSRSASREGRGTDRVGSPCS